MSRPPGTLSVEAKSFFPNQFAKVANGNTNSRALKSTLSADVAEFFPANQKDVPNTRGRFAAGKKAPDNTHASKTTKPALSIKAEGRRNEVTRKRMQHLPGHNLPTSQSSCKQMLRNETDEKILSTSSTANNKVFNAALSWSSVVKKPANDERTKILTAEKINRVEKIQKKSPMSNNSGREQRAMKIENQVITQDHAKSSQIRRKRPPVSDQHATKDSSREEKSVDRTFIAHETVKAKDSGKVNEKRKLTRTIKSFISSSSSSSYTTKQNINAESKNRKTDQRADILPFKELVNSFQGVEQSKDIYKITKSKHRLQNKSDMISANSGGTSNNQKDVIVSNSLSVYQETPKLSYSSILKKAPAQPPPQHVDSGASNVVRELTDEERRVLKKKQKALKRKQKIKRKKEEKRQEMEAAGEKQHEPVKSSRKEIKLDISDMFSQLLDSPASKSKQKKDKALRKVVVSTGVVSVVAGLAKKNTPDGKKVARNKSGASHSVLHGAIIKRGKERETPKKKKPTLLKKIIKAERERKKKLADKSLTNSEKQQTNETASHVNTDLSSVDPSLDRVKNEEHNAKLYEHQEHMVSCWDHLPEQVQKKLHSRKFREYCNHVLDKDINQMTRTLLVTLQRFQDRVYHENPAKYKQRRRFVLGLREVLKHLKLKKIKAVVVAPNLERISSEGGLDDYLSSILSICRENEVPQIFAMNRHTLGRTLKKQAPVSIVGIFNYDGAQDVFKELIENVKSARSIYDKKVMEIKESEFGLVHDAPPLEVEHNNPVCSHQQLNENEDAKPAPDEATLVRQRLLAKLTNDELIPLKYEN